MTGSIIGKYRKRAIHAREVLAFDEAGERSCWIRLKRFGNDWILLRAVNPNDVIVKVRTARGIPLDAESERYPLPMDFKPPKRRRRKKEEVEEKKKEAESVAAVISSEPNGKDPRDAGADQTQSDDLAVARLFKGL